MVEEGVEYGVAGSGEGEAVGAFGEAAGVWIVVESGLDGHLAVGIGVVILCASDDRVVVECINLHGHHLHTIQGLTAVGLYMEGHQLTFDECVAIPIATTGAHCHRHQCGLQYKYEFLYHII